MYMHFDVNESFQNDYSSVLVSRGTVGILPYLVLIGAAICGVNGVFSIPLGLSSMILLQAVTIATQTTRRGTTRWGTNNTGTREEIHVSIKRPRCPNVPECPRNVPDSE